MKFTYYGQAGFSVEIKGKKILFDPFITHNPLAKNIDIKSIKADYLFISHGHGDHTADAIEWQNKPTQCVLVAPKWQIGLAIMELKKYIR